MLWRTDLAEVCQKLNDITANFENLQEKVLKLTERIEYIEYVLKSENEFWSYKYPRLEITK